MAAIINWGGDGDLFVGEDKTLKIHVLDTAGAPVDITGWAITFLVRTTPTAATATLTKTASITGTFNAVLASNTQRAVVTLTDTELTITSRSYVHSWKRTDDGSETVLAYGRFYPQSATQ